MISSTFITTRNSCFVYWLVNGITLSSIYWLKVATVAYILVLYNSSLHPIWCISGSIGVPFDHQMSKFYTLLMKYGQDARSRKKTNVKVLLLDLRIMSSLVA